MTRKSCAILVWVGVATTAGCSQTGDTPSELEGDAQTQSVAGTEITLEEATAIALAEVPGAVDEAELETEDGVSAYSVDITRDSGEVEVRVDPATGTVLSVTEEGAEDEDSEEDFDEDDGDDEDGGAV